MVEHWLVEPRTSVRFRPWGPLKELKMGHMDSEAHNFGVLIVVIVCIILASSLVWILWHSWAWDTPHIVLVSSLTALLFMLIGGMVNE